MVEPVARIGHIGRMPLHEAVRRAHVAFQLPLLPPPLLHGGPSGHLVKHRLFGAHPLQARGSCGVPGTFAGHPLHVTPVGVVVGEAVEEVGAVDNPPQIGVVTPVLALLHGAETPAAVHQRVKAQRVGALAQMRIDDQLPVEVLQGLRHRDDEIDVDLSVALDEVAAVRRRDDHLLDGHRHHLLARRRIHGYGGQKELCSVLFAEGDDLRGACGIRGGAFQGLRTIRSREVHADFGIAVGQPADPPATGQQGHAQEGRGRTIPPSAPFHLTEKTSLHSRAVSTAPLTSTVKTRRLPPGEVCTCRSTSVASSIQLS